ncbi:MAG: hypothetical protein LBT49_03470 [Prevotellaceae bacterium]|jgi:hypothetical protein|nr:hypothetical protein [Prevotellaceae bacterium]
MKKMFLLLLCCPVVLAAQNGITISDYSVAPGTPTTVSFTVSWNKPSVDSAWVFVDYNNSGTMTRLPLKGATASEGSRAYMVDGNDRGAWVVADASGAFSATVQLVATCTDERPCVPTGACVYAIDYPPRGEAVAYNLLKLTGTPPFYVLYAGSTTYVEIDGPTAAGFTPSGTIAQFTDRTGAPGVLDCAQEYIVSNGKCSGCRTAYADRYNCGVVSSSDVAQTTDSTCTSPCCRTEKVKRWSEYVYCDSDMPDITLCGTRSSYSSQCCGRRYCVAICYYTYETVCD